MRGGLALCLLLAACGSAPRSDNHGATTAQIERVSTPKTEEPDPQATARVQPLTLAELDQAGLTRPSCDFSRDGALLLAISEVDAVAKVAGSVRHFTHASPVGPTGGFFEDRLVSVSVGRLGEARTGEGATGTWPARMTVTNRRAHVDTRIEGVWRCGT